MNGRTSPTAKHMAHIKGIVEVVCTMRGTDAQERVRVANVCKEAIVNFQTVSSGSVRLDDGITGDLEVFNSEGYVVVKGPCVQVLDLDQRPVSSQMAQDISTIAALRDSNGLLVIIGKCQLRNKRVAVVLDMFSDQRADFVIDDYQKFKDRRVVGVVHPQPHPSNDRPLPVPTPPKPETQLPAWLQENDNGVEGNGVSVKQLQARFTNNSTNSPAVASTVKLRPPPPTVPKPTLQELVPMNVEKPSAPAAPPQTKPKPSFIPQVQPKPSEPVHDINLLRRGSLDAAIHNQPRRPSLPESAFAITPDPLVPSDTGGIPTAPFINPAYCKSPPHSNIGAVASPLFKFNPILPQRSPDDPVPNPPGQDTTAMSEVPVKEHRGVLLGITKIEKPMLNLSPEERVAVARMCRDAVTSKAAGTKTTPAELSNPGLMSKIETGFMGIEVVISHDRLQLHCEDYMVSNQKIKELSAIVALRGTEGHLVIIGNCQKRHQRVAFVLDMFSDQQANEVIQAIQKARRDSTGPYVKPSIPPPVPSTKTARPIPQTLPSRLSTVEESGTKNSLDVYDPDPGTTSFPQSSDHAPTALLSPSLNLGAHMFTTSSGRADGSISYPSEIQKTLTDTAGVSLPVPGHPSASVSISYHFNLADTATVPIPSEDVTSISKAPDVAMPASSSLSLTSPELHSSDPSLTSNHSNNTTLSGQCEVILPQSYTPVFVSNPFNSTSLSIRPNSKLHFASSSTGTPLSNDPCLPRMMGSGLSFASYPEDDDLIRRVYNTPSPVICTSNNASQHARQPDFPAHIDRRSGSAMSFTDYANDKASSQSTKENYENDLSLRQALPDNQYENFDDNPSYVTTVKFSEESIHTTKPYYSGEDVSVRFHGNTSTPGTNIPQGRKKYYSPHLTISSTGTPLADNTGLPGKSSPIYPEDGDSFPRVSNIPTSAIATANNTPQHTRQPDFPVHMNRSGAAMSSPNHANAETSLIAPPHHTSVFTVKSSDESVHTTKQNDAGEAVSFQNHGNVELPETNTSHNIQENYENDVSLVQELPDDKYENLDNNSADVITVSSSEENVNSTKPNHSGEAASLQNHGNISIAGTNTSQDREEWYENDAPEQSLSEDQYEDVDNQDKNVNAHEDTTYENGDARSHGNISVVQAKPTRFSEKYGQSQEQPSVIVSQRQPSLVNDNIPPPLPPRWTDLQVHSSSSSANNGPGLNTPHISKTNMALPTKQQQHTTERQSNMSQASNIYGRIPGRPPPLPSVPPPLPPRAEAKSKKKILPSFPKVIGIRKEKDKTKDKKSKNGKDKKSKSKGTLQYSNEDIILMSKLEARFSGAHNSSRNYQTLPNVLSPPPPTNHAIMPTATFPTADDTLYDSDVGNEFIYEGDEYYTSLGMNVHEAERISMNLPASNIIKPSLSLRNDINNFLNNEYNYLGSVERISKARSLFPTQMQSLLRGTEALYDTHNTMYGEMYAGQSSCSKLAGVFIAHRKELEMYKYYMMNAPQMSTILKELPDTLKQSYPQLEDDIRGSWKRLHYYFMTLERMLDSAPEEDKASVTEAVEILRSLHLQADSGILIDSVKDAPYDLHLRAPLLLHHSFNVTGPGLKGRDFRVLLFTELIVITVPKKEQYDYQMDFRIEQTSIVSSAQETNSFSLEITFGGSKRKQVYSFKTSDGYVKDVWVKQIKRLQDEHAEKVKRERNKRYGLE